MIQRCNVRNENHCESLAFIKFQGLLDSTCVVLSNSTTAVFIPLFFPFSYGKLRHRVAKSFPRSLQSWKDLQSWKLTELEREGVVKTARSHPCLLCSSVVQRSQGGRASVYRAQNLAASGLQQDKRVSPASGGRDSKSSWEEGHSQLAEQGPWSLTLHSSRRHTARCSGYANVENTGRNWSKFLPPVTSCF